MILGVATLGFKLRLGIGICSSNGSRNPSSGGNRRRRGGHEYPVIPPLISLSKSLSIPIPQSLPSLILHPSSSFSPVGSESSISSPESGGTSKDEDEDEEELDPWQEVRFLDPEVSSSSSLSEWEIDFCSRPILDERGKKVWELVVCDSTLSLQYAKFFPNNVINSLTLGDAIASITPTLGLPLPDKIRFFWSQMQTIITKACNELGIKPVPSKRCISLLLWLEERYQTVYTHHPGFQQGSKPLLALDNPFPMELPENLFGDKWAFVQLPFSAVQEEASSFETRYAFGGSLDLDLLGIEVEDNTLIPGLAVASSRAKPLAAWMNGLEVSSVEADVNRACLILSVGVSTRYIYATYKKNAATTLEAEAWEAAKKMCRENNGLRFIVEDSARSQHGCYLGEVKVFCASRKYKMGNCGQCLLFFLVVLSISSCVMRSLFKKKNVLSVRLVVKLGASHSETSSNC